MVRDRIRELAAESIDWNYLFVFARRHGVLPLFYSRLQQSAADVIPPDQLQQLRKYFQENSARNVLLTAELRRLIDLFAKHGIEAIPYKGPVLALFAYGDTALRRFVDLDVMVRKEDVERAIDLIILEGYEFSKSLDTTQQKILLRTQHNVQFWRYNRQLILELHWEVASHLFASSVQANDLWKQLVKIDVNGATLKTLAVEDLIFSLAVHGSRHLWERLLWICDVAWIIRRHDLNWPGLMERARSTKTERMFLLGLDLCSRLLNVTLPDPIAEQIKNDSTLAALATRVTEDLFAAEHKPATTFQIFSYNVRVRRSWSSRLRYFRHVFKPTDRDVNALVLPAPFSFGYYLMRPFRLLFKTGEDLH